MEIQWPVESRAVSEPSRAKSHSTSGVSAEREGEARAWRLREKLRAAVMAASLAGGAMGARVTGMRGLSDGGRMEL